MAVAIEKTKEVLSIKVVGRFDFTVNREFREVCREIGEASSCIVDMKDATYVDSSALGMLLLLKEQVPKVAIRGASESVRRVLEIANFQRLFDLS
ncbi:MAG: STAS domain-containing protein [Myxococcota bacterium]